ncbi:MAG: hypothetical protein IPN08_04075 [Bacteroidales bacterium]|nr:hypothetical protein [Bacteroidales bacterium]
MNDIYPVTIGYNTISSFRTTSANNISHNFFGIRTGYNTNASRGSFTIRNNTIGNNVLHSISMGTATTTVQNYVCGIHNTGEGFMSIRNNTVQGLSAFGLFPAESEVCGIQFQGRNNNTDILRNYLHTFYVNSDDYNSSVTGISMGEGSVTFANNIIRIGAEVTTRSYVTGIYRAGGGAGTQILNVFFNSVYLNGIVTSGGGAPSTSDCIFLDDRSGSDIRVSMINNIFYNARSCPNPQALIPTNNAIKINDLTNPISSWLTSNYNDCFFTDIKSGAIGTIGGNLPYANLALWQAATNLDANSLSLDPLFTINPPISTSGFIPAENLPGLTGVGGITTDYDQDIRCLPTMGAQESFLPVTVQFNPDYFCQMSGRWCCHLYSYRIEFKRYYLHSGSDTCSRNY